jgi:hypothetical protein
MKKYLILFFLTTISGCATVNESIDAFLMKFDTNEYKLITDIRTTAELAKSSCSDQIISKNNVQQLYNMSVTLKNYAEHLPHNKPITHSSGELNEIISGFNQQYQSNQKVSEFFCQIKMDTISKNAITMQTMEGSKPR